MVYPKLSVLLRKVERKHAMAKFDVTTRQQFCSGICLAVSFATSSSKIMVLGEALQSHDAVMATLRKCAKRGALRTGYLVPIPRNDDHWDQRATMCLLMAEWLEDQGS